MDEGLRKDRYEKRQVKTREPDRSHLSASPMGEDDHHRGHLASGRGRPAPRSPRPWARTTITTVTSHMGKDDQHHGHLAHGRGRSAPGSPRPRARTIQSRSEEYKYLWARVSGNIGTKRDRSRPENRTVLTYPPRPWARTAITKVTSPMGENDQHHGHLAHGRGRPSPRSPRPWARTTSTTVTSPMGEDDHHQGHLAHGRGRPAPRSPRPWARKTSAAVISPTGEDDPRPVHLALGRGKSNPGQSDSFRLSCPPYSCDIRLLDHIPIISSRSELLSKFYD
ncbi:hypothetical protein DY000_02045801 [Brassica cretica]|uniref:DUF4005 domain-containing protein n=1 Tax=Brassica cretica TaxID=69181 RepID=A0ABQ7EQ01_BRACR|nr:hypothetical protein DY000_02045801 [Brassica cretica]